MASTSSSLLSSLTSGSSVFGSAGGVEGGLGSVRPVIFRTAALAAAATASEGLWPRMKLPLFPSGRERRVSAGLTTPAAVTPPELR